LEFEEFKLTYDLAFTGWVMGKIVCAHVFFFIGGVVYRKPFLQGICCYGVVQKEDEIMCCNLLRHDIFVMSSFGF